MEKLTSVFCETKNNDGLVIDRQFLLPSIIYNPESDKAIEELRKIVNKLGNYEIAEEDYKCPLDKLLYALLGGECVLAFPDMNLSIKFHTFGSHEIDRENRRFDVRKSAIWTSEESTEGKAPYLTGGVIFRFEDYGKTWFTVDDFARLVYEAKKKKQKGN